MRRFLDGEQTLPLGCRVTSIDRLGEVEARVAAGNEIAVKVGDVPIRIGIDGVVRRVRLQLHGPQVFLVACRLGPQIRLHQRLHRLLHQPDRHPLAILLVE